MNRGYNINERHKSRVRIEALIPRDDSSIVEIECAPADYSASRIAHAVEDADAHLVDLLTEPGEGGNLRVTLRVRRENPSGVVSSLERYGYTVTDVESRITPDNDDQLWRFLEFQRMLNV